MSVAVSVRVDGPDGAPVLVLGNSLGTTTELWADVVPLLADRFRIVRYDHRGHGDSPVPPGPYEISDLGRDVVALLDRLEVDRAAYCGVSIGGMVALWLGANAPERLTTVIPCCTAAYLGNASAWSERAATVLAAGSTEPIADAVVGRWVTPAFAAGHPEVVAGLRAMLLDSPAAGYAACCGALERLDLRADVARISVPALIVAAAGDESIPPEHSEQIAAAIPGARLATLDPAAHLPMAERPVAVADLIREHLEAVL